ncbi:alpha-L-fucosidase [Oceaniferula marina]|nr:alpha-L-fucosidase [Oceaniferula marina]
MKFPHVSCLVISCLSVSMAAPDPEVSAYAGASGWQESKAERTKWFKDAKFGMFIHWGLYAPAGGYWPPNPETGKKYPQHYSEWIRYWASVPEPEYGKLTKPLFQPAAGCTEQWAELAKDAGMQYTVLTTKHHDGYTLFNAKAPYSQKNDITGSTNISPKGRDMVAEYADSVRGQGLKVGYYYSIIDWQHPHAYMNSRKWPIVKDSDHSIYVKYMHSHMKQLYTDYGKSDIIWVDYSTARHQGSTWKTKTLLSELRELQPQLITNNRFWNDLQNPYGDFFTPEKYVPATGFPGRLFEVCHTMNESFGYSHHDTKWKSCEDVVHLLTDIVSKGGNLLLNVGPDAEGRIPEESANVLRETGEWLKAHGDSIYGTDASPFATLPFTGRCTAKQKDGKSYLYFHLFEWPKNKKIMLGGLKNKVLHVGLLGGVGDLAHKLDKGSLTIDLPDSAPSAISSVVVLEIEGAPEVDASLNIPQQAGDRSITLLPEQATLHGPEIKVEGAAFHKDFSNIGYWLKPEASVAFAFNVHTPGKIQAGGKVTHQSGKYALYIDQAVAPGGGGDISIAMGDQKLDLRVQSTGGWKSYKRIKVGEIDIAKAGKKTLAIKARKINPAGLMNIKSVELIPED